MTPPVLEFLLLSLSSLTEKKKKRQSLSSETGLPKELRNGQVSIYRDDDNIPHLEEGQSAPPVCLTVTKHRPKRTATTLKPVATLSNMKNCAIMQKKKSHHDLKMCLSHMVLRNKSTDIFSSIQLSLWICI